MNFFAINQSRFRSIFTIKSQPKQATQKRLSETCASSLTEATMVSLLSNQGLPMSKLWSKTGLGSFVQISFQYDSSQPILSLQAKAYGRA